MGAIMEEWETLEEISAVTPVVWAEEEVMAVTVAVVMVAVRVEDTGEAFDEPVHHSVRGSVHRCVRRQWP